MRNSAARSSSKTGVYRTHETSLARAALEGSAVDAPSGIITKAGAAVGVEVDGKAYVGFPDPLAQAGVLLQTLRDWKWAGVRAASLHPEPRPLVRDGPPERTEFLLHADVPCYRR
jgi:hypothetical protein